ncbi:MAG: CRISPR-associated endonuclease Cas3'' [Acidobacteria bacterium RIFCSPLOWO2_02_FULL_59_13]|nr:MAG: CRISPR-associated endonuclease Cas3'' [Acidobacteria bacterium RIFCSPLOWO2_02_FULL_59_13]
MKDDRSPAMLAHVRQDEHGNWYEHPLEEHLRAVGEMAAGYASTFDASSWARLAGVWHDLGKYSAEFQRHRNSITGFDGQAH